MVSTTAESDPPRYADGFALAYEEESRLARGMDIDTPALHFCVLFTVMQ